VATGVARVVVPRVVAMTTALAGLVASPGVVSAQITSPPLPSRSLFQTGPLTFYPALTINDAGFDRNVLGDHVAPREDYTYTVTPRLQAALPMGPSRLIGTGSAGFVYFRTLKEQQTVNGFASARFDTPKGRARPFGEVYFARTRERSDVDILQRVRRMQSGGSAGLDLQLSAVTALTGWVQRTDTAYDDKERYLGVDLATELNHRSQLVAAGTRLFVTPLTTIVAAVEYEQHRFDRTLLRDANSLRIVPTIELASGAFITGRFAAGYRDFTPLNPALPRYRGFVANARASYTLLGATRFDLEADRDVDFSFDGTQPYFLQSGARVTISQRIVGPLELVVVGGRRRVEYQADEAITLPQTDRIVETGAGFAVRVNDDVRLTFVYDRLDRQSNGRFGREFERRRVLGSLTFVPQ
jgi:hypothetical protein